jgi:hypothetical protein
MQFLPGRTFLFGVPGSFRKIWCNCYRLTLSKIKSETIYYNLFEIFNNVIIPRIPELVRARLVDFYYGPSETGEHVEWNILEIVRKLRCLILPVCRN